MLEGCNRLNWARTQAWLLPKLINNNRLQTLIMKYDFGVINLGRSGNNSKKLERIVKLLNAQNGEPEIVYYPSLFCQLSLPMASTEQKLFFRESGKVAMQLSTASQLPYGSIARRVLFYIANHISRSGIINIPKSQASVLKALGLGTSGADVKRLKVQLQALFEMTLTVSRDQQTVISAAPLFERSGLRYPTTALPQLSEPAKHQIFQSLTPLNKSAVEALIHTPFAFDLYTWLAWRAVSLKKPVTRISWLQLHRQFASSQNLAAFKQHFKRQLTLVALAYPAITDKVTCESGVLVLKRYQPHVTPGPAATKLSTASVE